MTPSTRDMLRVVAGSPRGALVVTSIALATCSVRPDVGEVGANLTIDIAPLSLGDVSEACYSLTVRRGADVVWRADGVCASRYGDDRGGLSYVGPCDASGDGRNDVSLVLDALYVGGATSPADPATYVNPCGDPSAPGYDGFPACVRSVVCAPNADAAVRFDLTIMREATQGFFDVAVELEDIFCSAKVDCRYPGEAEPIKLLFDEDGERDTTVVMGLACTGGGGGSTVLYMDDVRVTCGAESYPVPAVDPTGGPGSLDVSDALLFDVAVYRGVEASGGAGIVYWNVAMGLRDDAGPALGRDGDLGPCVLRGAMTAASAIWPGGRTPDVAIYPWLEVVVPLNDRGPLACEQHPIGRGTDTTGVIPRYTDQGGREFDAWFDGTTAARVRPPPTACTTSADCAGGLVCEAGRCVGAPGGACPDAMCTSGHVCVDGACAAGPLQVCGAAVACAAGLVCEAGTCLPAPWAPCPDGLCALGHACVQGTCRAPIGGACGLDGHCQSGWCREGACAPVTCQEQLAHGEAPACELMEGVCGGLTRPASRCRSDGGWDPCVAADYLTWSADYVPSEDDCDGLDGDCDGATDEACVGSVTLAVMSGGSASGRVRLLIGQAVAGGAASGAVRVGWGLGALGD